ncbi:MAG: cytochrome c [Gammaproteobacteria bacterium]|nr:cytochrome c [Gammaproteobacteria bacterium]
MRLCLVAIAAALLLAGGSAVAQEDAVARGAYLVRAGGCIDCHTEDRDGAVPLAGDRKLESPFGTFYSPNITPDTATGIGAWSDEDFVRAFWEGIGPEGVHYYPAFPYTSYTGVTRADLLAIKAYLFSLEPVAKAAREHDLAWYISSRMAAGAWKLVFFEPARFVADENQSARWNRGAYLVRHLGHCGECHTPRGALGAMDEARELAGNASTFDGEVVPNITPHRDAGIGKWSADDIEYFLDTGMLPDGDYVGSSMSVVIDNSTSQLTREDRLAIAAYLKSLPVQPTGD